MWLPWMTFTSIDPALGWPVLDLDAFLHTAASASANPAPQISFHLAAVRSAHLEDNFNVIASQNLAPESPWVGRENPYRFNLSARNCNEPSEIDSL